MRPDTQEITPASIERIVARAASKWRYQPNHDELIGVGLLAACKALARLDIETTEDAERIVRYYARKGMLDFLKRLKRHLEHCPYYLGTDAYEPSIDTIPELTERIALHSLLATLPKKERRAIVDHIFRGLTFEEIGRREGVSKSAVQHRCEQGYARLRRMLRQE